MNDFNGMDMLKKAYNIYDKFLAEISRKNNLTLNQLKILMYLESNIENNIAKNIVEGLGGTKSHISMSLSYLEKNGYVEKTLDERDKKKNHLHLTEKSFQIIEDGKKVKQKVKAIIFEGIKDKELKVLDDVSKKIKENLEKYNTLGG